jgi:hypothetical protein
MDHAQPIRFAQLASRTGIVRTHASIGTRGTRIPGLVAMSTIEGCMHGCTSFAAGCELSCALQAFSMRLPVSPRDGDEWLVHADPRGGWATHAMIRWAGFEGQLIKFMARVSPGWAIPRRGDVSWARQMASRLRPWPALSR